MWLLPLSWAFLRTRTFSLICLPTIVSHSSSRGSMNKRSYFALTNHEPLLRCWGTGKALAMKRGRLQWKWSVYCIVTYSILGASQSQPASWYAVESLGRGFRWSRDSLTYTQWGGAHVGVLYMIRNHAFCNSSSHSGTWTLRFPLHGTSALYNILDVSRQLPQRAAREPQIVLFLF